MTPDTTNDTTNRIDSSTRRRLLVGGLTVGLTSLSGCLSAASGLLGGDKPYTIEDVNVNTGGGVALVDITKVETVPVAFGFGGDQIQVTARVEPYETGDYRIRLAGLDSDGVITDVDSKTVTLYNNERATFMLFINSDIDHAEPQRLVFYVLPESFFEAGEDR